jgi:hypothetical protein
VAATQGYLTGYDMQRATVPLALSVSPSRKRTEVRRFSCFACIPVTTSHAPAQPMEGWLSLLLRSVERRRPLTLVSVSR